MTNDPTFKKYKPLLFMIMRLWDLATNRSEKAAAMAGLERIADKYDFSIPGIMQWYKQNGGGVRDKVKFICFGRKDIHLILHIAMMVLNNKDVRYMSDKAYSWVTIECTDTEAVDIREYHEFHRDKLDEQIDIMTSGYIVAQQFAPDSECDMKDEDLDEHITDEQMYLMKYSTIIGKNELIRTSKRICNGT